MIKITKCLYLKRNVSTKNLERNGFATLNNGETYFLDVNDLNQIVWYKSTRRFVFKYPKITDAKKILKYIPEPLKIKAEIRKTAEWIALIGDYRNYSAKKTAKIKERLKKINAKLNKNA